jgi:Protein of unknown function (DUF1203)
MKSSGFRIIPLPSDVAEAARRRFREGASDHAPVTADSPTGYPCRHCLLWARPGEQMILFPFASIRAGRPYAESGPIFIHAGPCHSYAKTNEYPADFRRQRVLRAYNTNDDMIDAMVIENDQPEAAIAQLFRNPQAAFLQARSVTRGCYTFRIERA